MTRHFPHVRFRHARFLGAATLASLSALVPACSDAPTPDGATSPATPGVTRPLVAAIHSDFRGPSARPALADVRELTITFDEAERAAPSLCA